MMSEKARKGAERMTTVEMMASLEARLNTKIADERERMFQTIARVLADGVFEPHEKTFCRDAGPDRQHASAATAFPWWVPLSTTKAN